MSPIDFDFDRIVDRRGGDSRKWGDVQARWGHADVLPMPMADMDFPVAPAVQRALQRRLDHGLFGYTRVDQAFGAAACDWLERRHRWAVDPAWLVPAPGVVPAVYAAARALCSDGGAVVVQPPLYARFLKLGALGVRQLDSPLVLEGERYRMDLEALEVLMDRQPVRALLLCNPHNPVGRAWSRSELRALGELCSRRDLTIIADEVFGDLCLPGQRFTPFASIDPELAARTITCTSASKAFNLAGLSTAVAIVRDPLLRESLEGELAATGFTTPGPFGLAASCAAWEHGGPWLDALLPYLAANFSELEAWLGRVLPSARLVPAQAGYLAWVDLRALGRCTDELHRIAVDHARVAPVRGTHFGAVGEGFLRFNIGCPRATLHQAMAQLERGFVPALEAR